MSGSWPRYISHAELTALRNDPTGNPAVRPNTPVLPYGTPSASAPTYIDPTARVVNGYAVIVSSSSFIAPYSTLDAHRGVIKIGFGSVILDNASIVANPSLPHTAPAPEVKIGNQVVIGYGAKVLGPSTIGAYGSAAASTGIGPGAVINQAIIAPGAYVSALAQVEGVTIPAGELVLPGQTVASAADLLDPTKVVTTTGTPEARQIVLELNQLRSTNLSLAAGYATLYQGQSATGASPGVEATVTTVFNGNLAAVEGAGKQPSGAGPTFPSPHHPGQVVGLLYGFRARVTGRAVFKTRASQVAHSLGRSNSIRADQGPITIGSIKQTGTGVTINSPSTGQLSIGENFVAGNGATILGGPAMSIGDNVSIGAGAVVDGSSLGNNSTVGAGAYLLNSPFKAAGSNIQAGAIWINGSFMGFVEK